MIKKIFEKLKLTNLTRQNMKAYFQTFIEDKEWLEIIEKSSDFCISYNEVLVKNNIRLKENIKKICDFSYLNYHTCLKMMCAFVSILFEKICQQLMSIFFRNAYQKI